MAPSKPNLKTSTIVFGAAAGVALSAIAGYFILRSRRSNQIEDADEGIGDVDSIVSEGEVEGEGLSQSTSNATYVTTSDGATLSKTSTAEFEDVTEEIELDEPEIVEQKTNNEILKPMKVLVLGLDGCGKTCLLNVLAKQPVIPQYKPTKGFNAVQIEKEGIALSIMEVGGSNVTRAYWKNFTSETSLLIYVVDGSNSNRFKESKMELKHLLEEANLNNVNCLLISNKQDVSGAQKADQVFTTKDLNDIGNKGVSNITLLNTVCVTRDNGRSDGEIIMDVIVGLLKEIR